MISHELHTYIQQCRQHNIADSEITTNLLASGWPQDIVDQALRARSKNITREGFIRLKNIYKEYLPTKTLTISALQNVNLEITQGEFVAITGQSGSGKTTLLNLIGLADEPTQGEIVIDDTDVHNLPEKNKNDFRLRTIGIIFQFFNLLDNYTALENISFQLHLQGYGRKEAIEKASDILQFLGLREKAHSYPKELSGGEQQRIAIGRALAKDSQILLADEPTAHLDSKNSQKVITLLRNINLQFKKTIILVTHELDYAEHADRVIVLKDGEIIKNYRSQKI